MMIKTLQAVLLSSVAIAEHKMEQDTCKALVMSGGGSNGAWMAGVVYGFVNYGDPLDFEYDVVAGVSIGSINASGLAMFEVGDEASAADYIYRTWEKIRTEDIYTDWPTKIIGGLVSQSMYDTRPAFDTMERLLSPFTEYKRAFSLSAVDISSGEVHLMTDQNTHIGHLHRAVVASASVPGFFAPTELDGMLLVDGMTAWNTNAQEAIDRCREMVGGDDTKITIDVLICDGSKEVPRWDQPGNTWENHWRAGHLRSIYHNTDSLKGVLRAHPNINWRHVLNQEVRAHGLDQLDFSPEITMPLLEQGK